MALYVTILIMQRDAWNAEEIHGALQDYMSGAYRDEKTHEFKDYSNVRTVEDFVNYMEVFVIDSVYVDQKVNYEDLAAIDLNTVMRYNRVSSGLSIVQRRAPKYTCDGASVTPLAVSPHTLSLQRQTLPDKFTPMFPAS